MARIHLLPFSPAYRFQVGSRELTLAGHILPANAVIPDAVRQEVTERTLRILYEQRRIVPVIPDGTPDFLFNGVGAAPPASDQDDEDDASGDGPDDGDDGEDGQGEEVAAEPGQPVKRGRGRPRKVVEGV